MKNQFILFSLAIILMSSCTALKVMSDYNEEVNFSEFQTFQLLKQESTFPRGANALNQERLEKGINARMTNLGFQESENPDLYVTYFVKKVLRENVVRYGEFYDEWNYPNHTEVFQYQEGTLVIDLMNVENKNLIWHGALSRTTNEDMKTAEKRINDNLNAMFKKLAKEIKK